MGFFSTWKSGLLAHTPDPWHAVADALLNLLALVLVIALGYVALWLRAQMVQLAARLRRTEAQSDKTADRLNIQRQGDLDQAELSVKKSDLTHNGPDDPVGSPVLITAQVRRLYNPIQPELRRMYLAANAASVYDSNDLSWEIEKRYREFFLRHVCPQLRLDRCECIRECVLIAMTLAREDPNGSVGSVD